MSSNHQNEVQMLNEYIVALEKQIKSIEVERQSLIQEVGKAEQNTNKAQIELRQLKNQFKELNTVLYRQNIEKTNIENKFKILAEENQKLKKQNQLKEQRITQLNNTVKDKSDQLAKEKNNLFLTTTFHTKQMNGLDDKIKEAEKKIIQINQERNLACSTLAETQEQLGSVRQENQKLFGKVQHYQKEVEDLQGRIEVLEKQIMEINNEKDLLNFNLQINNEELTKIRYENENLSMQLIHRSQNNEEAQKSFENFIQNLKFNHEHEIHMLRDQVQQHKIQIQQYKDSIQSLNNLLALQRSNFEKEYQKSSALTEEISMMEREIQRLKKEMTDELSSKDQIFNSQEKQYQSLLQKWKDLQQELERTINEKQSNEAYLNSKYEAFEIKYADDMRKKIDQIELLNNDFSLKTLELEETRYQLSESNKRQIKSAEEIKKREDEIDALTNQMSLKSLKIQELRFEVSEIQKKLQNKNKDYIDKERVCQTLLQKQSELNSQIQNLKKQVNALKEEKNNESKKLKKNIEGQDQEIIDSKKREARLAKQLKQTEDKVLKLNDDLQHTREINQKKLAEALQNLHQTQKEVQKFKKELREKDQCFKEFNSQHQLKIKEHANKEQELNKKYAQLETKLNKSKAKVAELEKELEKKDVEFNKTVEKMSIQQNSEVHEIKKAYETQLKQLENKTREQISLLSTHLEAKSSCVKQLEIELNKMQMASIQYSSNQSTMQKTIAMLQRQLEQSHKQNNSYHEKLFAVNNSADHAKQQLIEKDIKIISLNSQIQKLRKENSQLLNQISMLRTQVDALENSTGYLKRQITSTLDKQQVLLKEIRSLKQANKEMSKIASSNSANNLLTSQSDKPLSLINTSRAAQKNKSFLNLGEQFKNLSFKDIPTILEAVNEDRSRGSSKRKRETRSLHKQPNSPSYKKFTLPIALKAQEQHAASLGKDNVQELQMIPYSSMHGSINSSFYRTSERSRKASERIVEAK